MPAIASGKNPSAGGDNRRGYEQQISLALPGHRHVSLCE
jgi:hypothetical protein